jgi:hypothetical protein
VTVTGTPAAIEQAVHRIMVQLRDNPLRPGTKVYPYVPGQPVYTPFGMLPPHVAALHGLPAGRQSTNGSSSSPIGGSSAASLAAGAAASDMAQFHHHQAAAAAASAVAAAIAQGGGMPPLSFSNPAAMMGYPPMFMPPMLGRPPLGLSASAAATSAAMATAAAMASASHNSISAARLTGGVAHETDDLPSYNREDDVDSPRHGGSNGNSLINHRADAAMSTSVTPAMLTPPSPLSHHSHVSSPSLQAAVAHHAAAAAHAAAAQQANAAAASPVVAIQRLAIPTSCAGCVIGT